MAHDNPNETYRTEQWEHNGVTRRARYVDVQTRYIARAKHKVDGSRCKGAVSVVGTVTYSVADERTPGGLTIEKRRFCNVKLDEAAELRGWTVTNGQVTYRGTCPACEQGVTMHGSAVKGTYNPDKGCNAKCMGAVGPACDCSCGGVNHGGSHG